MTAKTSVDRTVAMLTLVAAAAIAIGSFGIEYSFSSDPLGPRAPGRLGSSEQA